MQKVLSIEIGITTTKVCEMDFKKKNPKVYKSVIFDTPENMIEDGYIRDKDSFADYMLKMCEKVEFKTKDVVFSISSNKILSREVTIPLVKDNRIKAVVEAKASEYFPRDITDHIVTYTILEKKVEEKKMTLLAFAAPSNLIKNYYSFAQLLDLNVVAVDYVGNSSYQWLKRIATTETNFVLQINEENSLVTIMNDGVLMLQRTINYGTNMLAEAVIESGQFGVDEMAAATELLQKNELLHPRISMEYYQQEAVENDSEHERMIYARQMITESMQLFISNLTRIIEYQSTRSHQLNFPSNIKEIIVTGGGAQIKGLDMLISNELMIPVENKKDMIQPIMVGNFHVSEDKICELITCLGASIAPVNFVPQDYVVIEQKKDMRKLYSLLVAATVIVSALLVFFAYQNYNQALQRKNELEQSIKQMSYIEEKYTTYLQTQEAYESLVAMNEGVFTYQEYFNELLHELETVLPSGTLVHSFTTMDDSFTMSITASSKAVAAQTIIELQKIPYIAEVMVTGLTENTEQDTHMTEVSFSVTCLYTKVNKEALVP